MAESKYPETAAVDAEYVFARTEYLRAERAMKDVAKRREAAHRAVEYRLSKEGQKFAGLSDAEWDAYKQQIEASRGPKLEPVVSAPGAAS